MLDYNSHDPMRGENMLMRAVRSGAGKAKDVFGNALSLASDMQPSSNAQGQPQQPYNALSKATQSIAPKPAEAPVNGINLFSEAMQPRQSEPAKSADDYRQKGGFGRNMYTALAAVVDPQGLQQAQGRARNQAMSAAINDGNYAAAGELSGDPNTHMKMQQYGQEQQREQIGRQVFGALSVLEQMQQVPEDQRHAWSLHHADQIEEITGQRPGGEATGYDDGTLNAMIGQLRQGAQMQGISLPSPPERNIIKGADGYHYYQDTGERVLPGVQAQGEAAKPITQEVGGVLYQYNQQTGEWDEAVRAAPPRMSPSDRLAREKFEFEQRKYEDERQTQFTPAAFGNGAAQGGQPTVRPEEYRESPFWNYQGEGAQLIDAAYGGFQEADFNDFEGGPNADIGAPETPPVMDVNQYSKYRGSTQGKQDAERLQDIQVAASDALNGPGAIMNEMQGLLEAGVPVGPFADRRANMSRVGMGWLPGVPDQKGGAQLDAFDALSTDLAVKLSGQLKGAISEFELQRIMRAIPNYNQSEHGAKMLLNIKRRMNDRVIDYAKAAAQWTDVYGGLSIQDSKGRSFDNVWAEYIRSDPLIDDEGSDARRTGTRDRKERRDTAGQNLPTISDDDDYDSLPPGAEFISPDGRHMRKPG